MFILICLICMIVSYLLGSVNFAIIFSKIFTKKDVREYGSGNAGMTNVIRTFGILPGALTFVGDFVKAAGSVALGLYVIPNFFNGSYNNFYFGFLCALFCTIGHLYPIFFGFKGGKGIVTSIGGLFMLDWRVATFLLSLFIVLFIATRIISISSIISVSIYPVLMAVVGYLQNDDIKFIMYKTFICLLISSLDIFMHRENIKRLLKGEEKKLTFGKGK